MSPGHRPGLIVVLLKFVGTAFDSGIAGRHTRAFVGRFFPRYAISLATKWRRAEHVIVAAQSERDPAFLRPKTPQSSRLLLIY